MALTKAHGHILADDLALGGNPTTSTQSTGNNTTRLATTAFVQTELAALVDSSPSALNTLNELAAALGDDANFSTTVTNSIATKAPLATPQFTNRVGIGVAAHGTAALNITSTAQHMRLNNGSELGILSLESDGALRVWSHGDSSNEIEFYQGSGSGYEVAKFTADGWFNSSANVATDNPPDSAGLFLGWNHSNGAGESHIVFNKGAGSLGGLRFSDNSGNGSLVELMRLENTGALGLKKIPPSGSHTSWSQLFVGEKGSLISENANSGGFYGTWLTDNMYIAQNTGAFKNITTDESSAYRQEAGVHHWYTQASGSADAAITLSEKMRIDSNGQVMIGHTSSFAHADADNLAIGDGTNNSGLTIYTGSSKESSIIFGNAGTNGNIEAGIKYYHESHGTVANRRAMTFATGGSMQERMRINSSGNVGIGTITFTDTRAGSLHLANSTGIAFQATSSQAASRAWRIRNDDMAWGSLDFTVGDSNSDFGDSAADVVMALTKDRRVGIGTTSPGALLEIEGDTNSDTFEHLTLRSTVDGNPSRVNMFFESGQGQLAKIEAEQRAGGSNAYGHLAFWTANAGTMTQAMTVNYDGNVGIGTASPGAKLEVNGKDDAGAGDLIRLIFDNSPADTGITFADINSTIKNRISMDASNTNDLYISTGTEMKFFCGTTGTSTTQVMHLKKINSNISTVHVGNGVIGPSSDITYRAQGSGENWRWGSNVSNSNSYWINSSSTGVYMGTGSTSWSSHSDERLKENITPLGEVLPSLLNMRCVKFNRKGDSGNTKVGFIAQDWEGKGFDEVVDEDTGFTIQDDGTLKSVVEEDNTSTTKPKSIAYTETIPLLLKAIQELEARIATLEG